jgi:DNA-binding NarL/FixJ family response regulator
LFFRSKLDAVANIVAAEVAYASDLDAAVARCAQLQPSLVIVDLSDSSLMPAAAVSTLHAAAPAARLVAFASHVDVKTLNAARAAGFDAALSKSEFTAQLPELLKSAARSPS